MGLLSSYELANQGLTVRLVESHHCGREASWAGGGIVSPLNPWNYSDPVNLLVRFSQGLYPDLVDRLVGESGIDPELIQTGLMVLSEELNLTQTNGTVVETATAWAKQYRVELKEVDQNFIRECQPGIATDVQNGLWMPQVCNVRNPRLLKALKTAVSQHPKISVHENTPVVELLLADEKVHGVKTKAESFYADRTVICGGAWSQQLLAATEAEVQIWPILGQMLLYKTPPGRLKTILLEGNRYLIPRKDGHILVGSTLENVGFDKATTDDALIELKAFAQSMLPLLADYPVIQQWSGLRPASPKGIPKIGPVSGYKNLYINAGHFRNGVVMAPGSVQLLVEQILGRSSSLDITPYQSVS